jgi:hypothetical protein
MQTQEQNADSDALSAYWGAKTQEEERAAYARMMELGYPDSYDSLTKRDEYFGMLRQPYRAAAEAEYIRIMAEIAGGQRKGNRRDRLLLIILAVGAFIFGVAVTLATVN